jgi:polyisoprenoid-binding protein YceI
LTEQVNVNSEREMTESTATTTRPPLAAGEYVLEPSHTHVGFLARHLVVTKVRGTFEKFETQGSRSGRPWPRRRVEVTIDVASLTSRDEKRDAHLRLRRLLRRREVPHHDLPLERREGERATAHFAVTGDLTIRDQTHPVTLDVEYLGTEKTPWGTSVSRSSPPPPRSTARSGA